jgi:hypothetical protein
VRRPADLLLVVFALAVVAVLLGAIRALPLGSTEAANDVSGWLLHIPRWLAYAAAVVAGVAGFVLAVVSLVVMGHVALSSRAQVQQLALACCLAQQAGVASPAVRLLGEMPGETLVLVTTIADSGQETGARS